METDAPVINITSVVRLTPIVSQKLKRTEYPTLLNLEHNLKKFIDISTVYDEINNLFEDAVREDVEKADDNDIVNICIHHENLETPLYITNARKKNIRYDKIAKKLNAVEQSERGSDFLATNRLEVHVTIIKAITGSGRSSKAPYTVARQNNNKTSVINIRNYGNDSEHSCFWNALATAAYYLSVFESDPQRSVKLRRFRDNTGRCQEKSGQQLAIQCSLEYNRAVNAHQFRDIQNCIQQKLVIVCAMTNGPLFRGNRKNDEIVVLAHSEKNEVGHYDAITDLKKYMGAGKDFCIPCWVKISKLGSHKCSHVCQSCYRTNCSTESPSRILCIICNTFAKSERCFEIHQKICVKIVRCPRCYKEVKAEDQHDCLTYFCTLCNDNYEDTPHYCYLQKINMNKLECEDRKRHVVVAFDIESIFKPCSESGVHEHTPILLVARINCTTTGSYEICSNCDLCPPEVVVYHGETCVKMFCTYLLTSLAIRAEQKKAIITVYAHNLKGYDGRFVLRTIWGFKLKNVQIVLQCNKILKIEVGNVRIIDSLSFFSLPLASLPACFNLKQQKGYFPYYSNIRQNVGEKIAFPDELQFGSRNMTPKQYAIFKQWYENQDRSQLYDLPSEMLKYCSSDVDILFESVMHFRKFFHSITGIDPTVRSFTLASTGLETFRALYLKENTIGITPTNSYKLGNSSCVGSAWLDCQEKQFKKTIDREVKIGRYTADGAIKCDRILFEMYGCHFHGHNCLYRATDVVPGIGKTANQLQTEVNVKEAYYRNL